MARDFRVLCLTFADNIASLISCFVVTALLWELSSTLSTPNWSLTIVACSIGLTCWKRVYLTIAYRTEPLRLEFHFRGALQTTVNVVAYAEFESVLEIDKNRNVIYDYWDGHPADRPSTGDGFEHRVRLWRRRTPRWTACNNWRFADRLRVQHRRRRRTGRTLDSAVPVLRRARRILLFVRSAASPRGVPHLLEQTLFRVDS